MLKNNYNLHDEEVAGSAAYKDRYYDQKKVLVFANVIDCYFLATNADRLDRVKPDVVFASDLNTPTFFHCCNHY
jgi:hypothetical protein